jgi:DNA primase catalytic core
MMIEKVEIEQTKQANPLKEYFQNHLGIKLTRRGKQYFCRCPLANHTDEEASCSVDPVKQVWHCFGCGEGGDIYTLIMALAGIDFRQAHERLGGQIIALGNNNHHQTDNNNSHNKSESNVEPSSSAITVEQLQWLAAYVADCHKLLLQTAPALDYAHSRGISNETIIAFNIGYSDGEIAKKLSKAGRAALTSLGILNKSGRDLFAGYMIFPLVDGASGQVVSIYGRSISGKEHRYLPGPRCGLFNPIGARNSDEIILVEGVIDAAALISAGINNAMPIYGTNGLTDELIAHLKECRVKRAVLMLDNDEAGRKACQPIIVKLAGNNIIAGIMELPAKDPAEFIAGGGNAEQLRAIIKEPAKSSEERSASATKPKPVNNGSDALIFSFYQREYEVRGLTSRGLDRLKVNIRFKADGKTHMDTLDLYQAHARESFAQKVGKLIGEQPQIIESNLLEIAEQLEAMRLDLRADKKEQPAAAQMTAQEEREALAYLQSPDLINRLVADAQKCGFVGERSTILMGILATISRKLSTPISLLIVARSGAGKSSLQQILVSFAPPEDVVWVTRLTGQALFYKDPNSLKGKVLAIVEEGGATEAIYSLRNLASDQRLSIAVTQTNPQTGELRTQHYDIYGPVSIIITTTSPEAFDEETRSRFALLTMDESCEQTRAILQRQRRAYTLEGVIAEASSETIKRLHHNAQRLLRPLKVVNPYVEQLDYPAERLIARREHPKYLTLINTIALLHQHQREIKRVTEGNILVEYIEVQPSDIAIANELAKAVLWRSFDELAPPVRGMLKELRTVFEQRAGEMGIEVYQVQLSRREIRRATQWSEWQVKNYCQKLVEMEYLYQSANGNGKPSLYRLLEPLEEDAPALPSLALLESAGD